MGGGSSAGGKHLRFIFLIACEWTFITIFVTLFSDLARMSESLSCTDGDRLREDRYAEQSLEATDKQLQGQGHKVGTRGKFIPKMFKYLKTVFFTRS